MTQVEWIMVQLEPSESALIRTGHPVRTCVGCRKRELAADLLRIVARGREADVFSKPDISKNGGYLVVPDPQRRLPGRGAWLHPVSACLSGAIRRRAFGRALRVSGNPDISALEQYLENRHEHSNEQTVKHQR